MLTGDLDYLKQSDTLPRFDAFVLFAEEDRAFVDQLVAKMEGEFHLKLCLRERDLIAGLTFENQAITRLIETRCNFVLPILSPSFFSNDNKFLVDFTEALAIGNNALLLGNARIDLTLKRKLYFNH